MKFPFSPRCLEKALNFWYAQYAQHHNMQWKLLWALAASSDIACRFWIQIWYNLLTFSLHMLYVSSRPSFGEKLYNIGFTECFLQTSLKWWGFKPKGSDCEGKGGRRVKLLQSSKCFQQLLAVFQLHLSVVAWIMSSSSSWSLHNTDFQIYLFMTVAYCIMQIM